MSHSNSNTPRRDISEEESVKSALFDDSYYWNPDSSTWDESIFEWCRETGFNPFGSGPTPIFCAGKKGPIL